MSKRTVICHYHIYKNSGTSFEKLLRRQFGDHHISFDSPIAHFQTNQEQLAEIVAKNHSVASLSSHQIHLPLPSTLAFRPIGVVFLRHPLLRLGSIFRFEQGAQKAGTEPASLFDGFDDWITMLTASDDRRYLLSNEQTNHLSRPYLDWPKSEWKSGRFIYDIDQAITNLHQVQCLGRTEYFDEDVSHFTEILTAYDISFRPEPGVAENTSSPEFALTLEAQLQSMKSAISSEVWEQLIYLNHQDLELYDYASTLIAKRQAEGYRPYLSENI